MKNPTTSYARVGANQYTTTLGFNCGEGTPLRHVMESWFEDPGTDRVVFLNSAERTWPNAISLLRLTL